MIVTRFAPSPTGDLHLGGLRIALFNYLLSVANKGKFILRIDDTNPKLCQQQYLDNIFKTLDWIGIKYDQIIYQSNRHAIYEQYAQRLYSKHIYSCLCQQASHQCICWVKRYDYGSNVCLKMSIEHDQLIWSDLNYGNIQTNNLQDWVVRRSDGLFTYNFCSTIDDIDLGITHVVRGSDHLENTAKQILICMALEAQQLQYAHLPLIINESGHKLSKRYNAPNILNYIKSGYLPSAIQNFLIRLSVKTGNEDLILPQDFAKFFEVDSVQFNKAPVKIDEQKLIWFNRMHLRNQINLYDLQQYALFNNIDISHLLNNHYKLEIISEIKLRVNNLCEFISCLDFLKSDYQIHYKQLDDIKPYILQDFLIKSQITEDYIKQKAEQYKIDLAVLISCLRYILTGVSSGYKISKILTWLDPNIVTNRIKRYLTL